MSKYFLWVGGLFLLWLVSFLSIWLAEHLFISSAIFAIILGMILGISHPFLPDIQPSVVWCERTGLGLAVALLGFQMPWQMVASSGSEIIILIISGIIMTVSLSILFGYLMRIKDPLITLVAIGSAICGSAAVMASQSIINSDRTETAMAVTLINLLGLLGIIAMPWVAQFFFPNQELSSGALIGNTLQSMPHVVAAGISVSESVTETAIWTKMIRILMLMPVLFLLALWCQRRQRLTMSFNQISWFTQIPKFIWGFIFCSLLTVLLTIPQAVLYVLEQISDTLMLMALAAIGMQVKWTPMRQQGIGLLFFGTVVFITQTIFSIWLLHHL